MIEKYENGDWEEFELVNGIKQGQAIYHYSENNEFSRKYEIVNYIDDIRQGEAILYWTKEYEGDYEVRNYVNGLVQGKANYYYSDGSREERTYVNGELQGKATYYFTGEYEGDYEEVTYVNGELQGKSIYYCSDGSREERTYVNGELQGKAIWYSKYGEEVIYWFIDGECYTVGAKKTIEFQRSNYSVELTFDKDCNLKEKYTKYKTGEKKSYVENYSEGYLYSKRIYYNESCNNKIKSYVEGFYKDGDLRYKGTSYFNCKDKNGNSIEEINEDYYEDNKLKSKKIIYKNTEKNKLKEKGETYYENGNLKEETIEYRVGEKDTYGNIISYINKSYYENGNLKEEKTEYIKVSKIYEYNNLFIEDISFIDDIKSKIKKYNENGRLNKITLVYDILNTSNNMTSFESSTIFYNAKGEINHVDIWFRKRIIDYYYEDKKLVKMTKKRRNRDLEIYKTVYYDKNGNISNYEIEDEDDVGFFGKIFNNLGTTISEKISGIDIKETLININDALDKHKK